jgi:hypothetical protein
MDFKKYMSPDFQASSQPAMDWMPWEQNNDAGNMGNIVDQLKMRNTRMQGDGYGLTKAQGQIAGDAANAAAGAPPPMLKGGKGGGTNSL